MRDEPKMNANRQKKAATIDELTGKVQKAKAMVFTNYQGMTHLQLEGLKKTLKKIDAEIVVTKNTLLNRALGTLKGDTAVEKFDQPTATLFAYEDIILPLKELIKTLKPLNPAPEGSRIKGALVEGRMLEEKDIVRLSTLPPKEVLLGQLVGSLKSPIYGLHRSLSWNLQKFIMTLKAVESKKV